jgi:tetratricopeptide (TPR) repeat protein
MKRNLVPFFFAGLLAVGMQPAMAQATGCGVEREVKTGLLDEPEWKKLNQAYELVGEEKYDEAYSALVAVRERAREDDKYVRAIVAQAIAQVEWSRGNYDAALREFELAVKLDALPHQTHFSLMYQIAQLYFMKDRYDDSLKALELWFCKVPKESIKSSAYVLKASIFGAKEDWQQVITAIDQAIELDEKPQEPWYQLKLAAHFELSQWPEAARTLEAMVSKWPNNRQYWIQLSNTYFKQKQDDKALAAAALAHRKGLLDRQADILYLSNLYSLGDVPFKAAEVLQQGIEDGRVEPSERYWTMIADTWYAAQELDRALAAYENAGKTAMDGKIDLRRGYILIDMERWEDANEALSLAIEKGGITEKQTGEAHLMQGMAQFNLGNFDQASASWGRASRYESAKSAAQQWMNHMREERARTS